MHVRPACVWTWLRRTFPILQSHGTQDSTLPMMVGEWLKVSPVRMRMGRGEPSLDIDVAWVSPVLVQMWTGRAHCGRKWRLTGLPSSAIELRRFFE